VEDVYYLNKKTMVGLVLREARWLVPCSDIPKRRAKFAARFSSGIQRPMLFNYSQWWLLLPALNGEQCLTEAHFTAVLVCTKLKEVKEKGRGGGGGRGDL